MQYLILGLNILLVILVIILILKNKNNNRDEIDDLRDDIREDNKDLRENIMQAINENARTQNQVVSENQRNQMEMISRMASTQQQQSRENAEFMSQQSQKIAEFQSSQNQTLMEFQREQFGEIRKSNDAQQERILSTLDRKLEAIQASNDKKMADIQGTMDRKLDEVRGVVGEKLDKTLNERLDSNFKQISENLGELYRSLGELNKLSSGVNDLNKTLSNVKTRGTWGEIQLQSILDQTMTPSQYDTNIATKKNSNDRVEFAIKIPSKEDDSFVYLPIDSKMPSDIYNKIVDASQNADQPALASAVKELETRIKTEARTIRDKYIDPPATTDFAIMFLPTEGLYSEALRIAGLAEWCHENCRVIISGPTTITALLSSLRIGFSNMALTKKSQDVLKLLQAIKTQYKTFSELIDKTQKKLHEAMTSTDNLKSRADLIQRRMSKVEQLDIGDSNTLLGIETDDV